MSAAIAIIFAIIVASIAYARGVRSSSETKRSNAGFYVLGALTLLFVGLWVSGQAGNEPAAYGFGIAIGLSLLIIFIVGVASAIGRAIRRRKGQSQ